MAFLKKAGLILWFVLIAATLTFSSNDMDTSQLRSEGQPSNYLVKRQNLKTKPSSCQGSPGLPGRDGRDGRDATLRGARGEQGAPGPAGSPGPQGESSSTGGVVYTR